MERVLKKIVATIILTILILMSFAQVMSYAVSMYATAERKNGYTYKANGTAENKIIYDYSYGNDGEGDLYCMQVGAHIYNYAAKAETYTKYSLNNYMKNSPTTANVSDFESKTGAKLKSQVTYYGYSLNDSSKVKTLKAIMWLVKNMYARTDNQNEKNWMAENITNIMEKYCSNDFKPSKNTSIKIDGYNAKLSDEEIRVIQQLVLWRFMNIASDAKEANYTYGNIANSGVYSPDDLGIINAFNTADKKNNGYALYSALCAGAIDNANNPGKFGIDYSSNAKAQLTDNSNGKVTLVDSSNHLYRFGPINVELANLKTFKAKVNVNNLLSDNSVTSAYLGDANKNSIVTLNTNGSYTGDIRGKINNKNIYVYIKTKNILQENENAKITLTYQYDYKPALTDDYDINMYWRKNGNEFRQPVLEIKKGLSKWDGNTKNISASIKNASIDVALTKEVNKIFRYSQGQYTNVYKGERSKVINKEEIKMDKSPITVVPGDIIRYKLTIYNQGKTEAIIKQIKDYLCSPMLEYLDTTNFNNSDSGNDYYHNNKIHQSKGRLEYRVDDRCMVVDYSREPITLAKDETKEIFIECKVKSASAKDYINLKLCNVAAITEYGYMQDGVYINATNKGIDIDSIQNNIKSINDNIDQKIFNRINIYSSLYNIDKRLPAIDGESADYILEDDEDFELVKIGGFDLSLRKFVDSMFYYDENGEEHQITIASRSPKIYSDTTTHFKEGGTTALYYHKKVPLEVQNGYRIRYKIRVYNEGYIPGYATTIADYLPEGLEVIKEGIGSYENKTYGWSETTTNNGKRLVRTNHLQDTLIQPSYGALGFSDLMNDTARVNDKEEPFFKEVILNCKVNYTGNKNHIYLTNVAEIAESSYDMVTEIESNGNIIKQRIAGDIDSSGDNVFSKVSNVTNVDTYRQAKHNGRIAKGYTQGIWHNGDNKYYGVEDDDDFENLIIYKYDIALRKYISEITKKDGTKITPNDRTPKFDGTNIESDHNATYTHKKDPITVEDGDKILYKLRIYNEGKTKAVVKQLVDYLPEGLELDTSNANYWEKANDTVNGMTKLVRNQEITVPAGTTNEYNENKDTTDRPNFCTEISIACKVNCKKDGEILTNIAEITDYGYMEGNTYVQANADGVDIDSIQNNVFSNNITPEKYIDNNYKEGENISFGEEDDDDFERVIVESKHNFNIELEKTDDNGTKLNGSKFQIVQYEASNIPVPAIEIGSVGKTTKNILTENETINGSVTKQVDEILSNKNYFYKVKEKTGVDGYWNILEGYTVLIPVYVDNNGNVKTASCDTSDGSKYWEPAKGFIIIDDENNTKVNETDDIYNKVNVTVNNGTVKISVKNPVLDGIYRLHLVKKESDDKYIKGIKFKAERIIDYKDENNDGIDDNGKIPEVLFENKETSKNGFVSENNIGIANAGVDKYIITEIADNKNEYIELNEPVTIYVKKELDDGKLKATNVSFDNNTFLPAQTKENVKLKDDTNRGNVKIRIQTDATTGNAAQVIITNPKITGSYNLQLEKVGENDNTKLSGVTFSAKDKAGESLGNEFTTNNNGTVQIIDKTIESATTDWYDITEVNVGENQYAKLDESVRVYVETVIAEDGNSYKLNRVSFNPFENDEGEQEEADLNRSVSLAGNLEPVEAQLSIDGNTIKLTIQNRRYEGQYILRVQKVDDKDNRVKGAKFEVDPENGQTIKLDATPANGTRAIITKAITEDNVNDVDKYVIREVGLNGKPYVQLDEDITFYVHKKIASNKYKATSVSFNQNEIGSANETLKSVKLKGNKGTVDVRAYIHTNYVDIIIPNKQIEGKYGIELLKTKEDKTTALPGVTFTVTKGEGENAKTVVDKQATGSDGKVTIIPNETKITTNDLEQEVYTITENSTDSRYLKMSNEIKLYVTKGLNSDKTEYVVTRASFAADKELKQTDVELTDGTKLVANVNVEDGVVKVTIPNKEIEGNYGLEIVKTGENDAPLKDVEFSIIEGEETSAKDITPTNNKTNNEGKLTVFTKETRNITSNDVNTKDVYTIEEIKVNDSYVALPRPLTIYVTKGLNSQKTAYVATNASFSKENSETTQNISLPNGKIVTVSLNVQNSLVTVTIPNHKIEGKYDLELIKVDQKDGESALPGVTFDIKTMKGTEEVKLYNTNGEEIITKGLTTNSEGKIVIPNVKITEGAKYNFEITETKVPNGYVMLKDKINVSFDTKVDSKTQSYVLDNATVNGVAELNSTSNKLTVKVQNGQFDLALRKYISGITVGAGSADEKKVTLPNRVPVFKIGQNGEFLYEHSKETVAIGNQNVVEYTLRVYNEGSIAGYAKEIKDDIPEGLEFLPEDSTNKKYGWKLLDEQGNEVKEVNKAKYIVSNYLSKEQEENEGDNLLKAFNTKEYAEGKLKEPDYKEVKVAFKVTMPKTDDRIITNKAQISKDSDKDGKDVTDKDSTPDEWIDGEDDQDIEKVKVQFFDLALKKWISKAIVIEDGKETITETGHTAEDEQEEIVKVDLKDSKINNVVVKFEYKIRVSNEGEIAGYAKEISDYIPEGLKMDLSDNPNWKEAEGKIVTEELKDTILEPGESKDVTVILTWINRKDNLGLKQNVAEISKDYNVYGSADIDSTPANKVVGEDDIDDASVMITVKTGQAVTFVGLTITVITILGLGIILIKKYVIK